MTASSRGSKAAVSLIRKFSFPLFVFKQLDWNGIDTANRILSPPTSKSLLILSADPYTHLHPLYNTSYLRRRLPRPQTPRRSLHRRHAHPSTPPHIPFHHKLHNPNRPPPLPPPPPPNLHPPPLRNLLLLLPKTSQRTALNAFHPLLLFQERYPRRYRMENESEREGRGGGEGFGRV